MFDNGIFIFGSTKQFYQSKSDYISSLPLELSWKIFSYLDDGSLRKASLCFFTWKHIIRSNKKLKSRLNKFELFITFGSHSIVKYCKKRIKKKNKSKNYLPVRHENKESKVELTKTVTYKSKRKGGDISMCMKRYKLF